jgi:hypothetical protein
LLKLLNMNEPLEIQIPIKILIRFKNLTLQEDNTYKIKWFDNTEKIVESHDISYFSYNIQEVLQQINVLYQLNPNMIKYIKIETY